MCEDIGNFDHQSAECIKDVITDVPNKADICKQQCCSNISYTNSHWFNYVEMLISIYNIYKNIQMLKVEKFCFPL